MEVLQSWPIFASAEDPPTVPEPSSTDLVATASVTQLLAMAMRTVTSRVEAVLKPEGVSLDQWLVIEALARQRGLTMAELATRTMATGPTLTRVVDRLVSTATAYREVDAEDRRKVRVYLSPRGRLAHRRIAAKVRKVERDLLDRTTDPASALELLARWAETR